MRNAAGASLRKNPIVCLAARRRPACHRMRVVKSISKAFDFW